MRSGCMFGRVTTPFHDGGFDLSLLQGHLYKLMTGDERQCVALVRMDGEVLQMLTTMLTTQIRSNGTALPQRHNHQLRLAGNALS